MGRLRYCCSQDPLKLYPNMHLYPNSYTVFFRLSFFILLSGVEWWGSGHISKLKSDLSALAQGFFSCTMTPLNAWGNFWNFLFFQRRWTVAWSRSMGLHGPAHPAVNSGMLGGKEKRWRTRGTEGTYAGLGLNCPNGRTWSVALLHSKVRKLVSCLF